VQVCKAKACPKRPRHYFDGTSRFGLGGESVSWFGWHAHRCLIYKFFLPHWVDDRRTYPSYLKMPHRIMARRFAHSSGTFDASLSGTVFDAGGYLVCNVARGRCGLPRQSNEERPMRRWSKLTHHTRPRERPNSASAHRSGCLSDYRPPVAADFDFGHNPPFRRIVDRAQDTAIELVAWVVPGNAL
jgi:hypothetical protein